MLKPSPLRRLEPLTCADRGRHGRAGRTTAATVRGASRALIFAALAGPSTGCAVPCVDDGLLKMQHDPACAALASTGTGTGTGTGAGASTSTSTDASTSTATSTVTTDSSSTGVSSTTTNTGSTGDSTSGSTGSSSDGSSTGDMSLCGDGVLDPDEQCDDGANNGDTQLCKSDCTDQACGDGFVGAGEGCDDGNVQGGDGCSAACVSESCGDGVVDGGEACDDGENGDPDDGCTDLCTLPVCGDALVQPSLGEGCDAGVDNSDQGICTLACKAAFCGDGLVWTGEEACDDGVNDGGYGGCAADCQSLSPYCGDAVKNGPEACDDGVNDGGYDGCAVDCEQLGPYCGDMVKNGRRGSLSGKLTVKGVQGHIAYPHLAKNPIHLAAPALAELAAVQWDRGNAYFPPTSWQMSNIHAGTGASNVIPGQARAKFNIRYNDNHTQDSLRKLVEERLTKACGNRIRARIVWEPSNSNVFVTKPGPLTDLAVAAIQEVTGRTPELSTSGGTSDARFISHYCPVIEFGLVGQTMHQIDERTPVSDLEKLTRVYHGVLDRYFG